jgi:hypothetical protein
VLDTSPELQHEFCALWNELPCQHHDRLPPWGDDNSLYDGVKEVHILAPIREIFIALHLDDDSAQIPAAACDGVDEFPHCNMHGHHSDSTPPILDVSASTSNALTVLHDDGALIPLPLDRNSCAPSTSVPTTSPDPAVAGAARDIETSARIMPPTSSEASTSTSFIHPSGAVSLQNNKDLAQTDAPDISSWASPAPGLDNILPTRTPLTFALPSPEPHFSILLAETSPDDSPRHTSAHELGAMTKDEGSPNVGLPLPSVIRAIQADTMTILDGPPQLPPLPAATYIAIAGPSRREPDVGHTGDRPHPSHSQYDIV